MIDALFRKPVRLAVALARIEAGQPVVLVDLVGEVTEARRDVGLVQHDLSRTLHRHVHVHAPVAERAEEPQLVLATSGPPALTLMSETKSTVLLSGRKPYF